MSSKKWFRIWAVLLAVLLVLFGVSLYALLNGPQRPEPGPEEIPVSSAEPAEEPVPELEEYEYDTETLRALSAELAEDTGINPDVKALLCFESGLIHTPVLQSADVNEYLYKDWQTGEYLSYGSIVLEPENDLSRDDQNTIIYGHYIYEFRNADRTLAFTPLAVLMKEEALEENRYVSLITADDVRYYEIAAVFECPLETYEGYQYAPEGLEYNLLAYDKDYVELYRKRIAEYEYYPTGIAFDETDRFLSLQTCIEGKADSREIVLCRELKRTALTETE